MTRRETWSGRLGFVLAAVGSAVGLGNLWKFPYITWHNDGGAFVLVYLACVVVIGVPVMMSELLIGRRSERSPVAAFATLGGRAWRKAGWLPVVAGVVILAFYSVIAGWSLRSFARCLRWSIDGYTPPAPGAFAAFLADGPAQVGLALAFLALTALVVVRGISGGIEKATRILMPVLFVIMLYLLVTAASLPGFTRALALLFHPDWSAMQSHGILEALGHAFFTLSLGMGAMITYGSYLGRDTSIVRISITVAILDTLIALAACVIMFAVILTVPELETAMSGEGAKSTVGMLFVTLPRMFYTEMAGGAVVAPLFYVLVAFAALSSTISLLEVTVATAMDRLAWTRARATLAATLLVGVLTTGCAVSLGASESLTRMRLFGRFERLDTIVTRDKTGLLAIFDHVSANWLLPLAGLAVTMFAGWALDAEDALDELFPGRRLPGWVFRTWRFLARYVCPMAIGWIVIDVIRGGDFS